jgi:hypothetical protein
MLKDVEPPTEDDSKSIVFDKYRVIVPLKDADLGESVPRSWAEVAAQMNSHLMRIASGATRLVAELLESTTRLLRGLSGLPASVSKRLEQAHDSADRHERQRQLSSGTNSPATSTAENARKEIAHILQKYRVQGYIADVAQTKDGKAVIMILPPDAPEALDTTDHTETTVEPRRSS